MTLTGATFCSGIGAPEQAAPFIDWRLASEIERHPRAVLSYRFGYSDARRSQTAPGAARRVLWGDMTALRPRHMARLGIPFPDLIVAGTPCQAFSFAGKRASLADARGNLTLQLLRMIHAFIASARQRRHRSVRWLLWENVPGVLSTPDNAFGCFLGGLVGADGPLHTPDGKRWPDLGMVAGPRARALWRILDAQYFGLAQRRRRVFVVAGFGAGCDPAAILFERRSLRRDHPPRREAGQATAGTLSARTGGGGGLGTDFELDGGLIASTGDLSHCLNAGAMGRQDFESETLIAHTLRAEGFDASEDGTGRGIPLVPVAMNLRGREGGAHTEFPDVASLRAAEGGSSRSYIAFTSKDYGGDAAFDLAPTLRAGGCQKSHANSGIPPAVAMQGGVRRLTPRECARLQGFPDDHTLVPGYGGAVFKNDADMKEMAAYLGFASEDAMRAFDPPADGPQYKSYGNSMPVPALRFLLARIARAEGLDVPQWGEP